MTKKTQKGNEDKNSTNAAAAVVRENPITKWFFFFFPGVQTDKRSKKASPDVEVVGLKKTQRS